MIDKNNSQPIKRDTLDFIFEYTKNASEVQLKDVESLDNKVIQILSISSIIIGLIAFAIGRSNINYLALMPLVIALLAYIALVISAFIHLKARGFRRSIQADVLWENYWQDDIEEIKHSLVDDIGKAYAHNKRMIDKKARILLYVTIFAAIEVIAVGGFIILATFFTSL